MKTINKPGDNLGGLLKIWAVPQQVLSLNGKTVIISSSEDVYQIYCTPETIIATETSKPSEAGTFYEITIQGFIPKDTEELSDAVNDMNNRPYYIIYQDGNGNFKLAGTTGEALRLNASLSSGKQESDRAGYTISFSGKTLSRSVFVTNPF